MGALRCVVERWHSGCAPCAPGNSKIYHLCDAPQRVSWTYKRHSHCPYFDGAEIAQLVASTMGWSGRTEMRIIQAGLALIVASVAPAMLSTLVN